MGGGYCTYTREFKVEALQLLAKGGKSAAELERELGITNGMLLKWRQRYKMTGQQQTLEPSDMGASEGDTGLLHTVGSARGRGPSLDDWPPSR